MKRARWNDDKDDQLRIERGVSFSDIASRLDGDDLLADITHPNVGRYPGQRMFVVRVRGYVYLVPYVQSEESIFLKTIIPSRKAKRKYLR